MSEKEGKLISISIGTILSARTGEGRVEWKHDGELRYQWDITKAKVIRDMLTEAIEAAISDELIFKFFNEKIGFEKDKAAMVLRDFRELRQGSRDTVFEM